MIRWDDQVPLKGMSLQEALLAALTLLSLVALVVCLWELEDAQERLQAAQWRLEILEEHSYADCSRIHPQSWDPPGREIIHLDCPETGR